MITKKLKEEIIAAIARGEVSAEGELKVDSVTVFRKGSPAYDASKDGRMPIGNFKHEGAEYAVYLR